MKLIIQNQENSYRLFIKKDTCLYITILLGLLLWTHDALATAIDFNSAVNKVVVVDALPMSQQGVDVTGKPHFRSKIIHGKNGIFNIELTDEPIFIIEGDLPKTKVLPSEYSPFGFHPASGKGWLWFE